VRGAITAELAAVAVRGSRRRVQAARRPGSGLAGIRSSRQGPLHQLRGSAVQCPDRRSGLRSGHRRQAAAQPAVPARCARGRRSILCREQAAAILGIMHTPACAAMARGRLVLMLVLREYPNRRTLQHAPTRFTRRHRRQWRTGTAELPERYLALLSGCPLMSRRQTSDAHSLCLKPDCVPHTLEPLQKLSGPSTPGLTSNRPRGSVRSRLR
jgi:hypothetical protein